MFVSIVCVCLWVFICVRMCVYVYLCVCVWVSVCVCVYALLLMYNVNLFSVALLCVHVLALCAGLPACLSPALCQMRLQVAEEVHVTVKSTNQNQIHWVIIQSDRSREWGSSYNQTERESHHPIRQRERERVVVQSDRQRDSHQTPLKIASLSHIVITGGSSPPLTKLFSEWLIIPRGNITELSLWLWSSLTEANRRVGLTVSLCFN